MGPCIIRPALDGYVEYFICSVSESVSVFRVFDAFHLLQWATRYLLVHNYKLSIFSLA